MYFRITPVDTVLTSVFSVCFVFCRVCADDRQRCLTRAAKHEPQNVAIRSELRSLSKLAQNSGGETATDPAPAAAAESAGDRRNCARGSKDAK